MIRTKGILLGIVCSVLAGYSSAQKLEEPQKLKANGSDLTVGWFAAPTYYDLDNDGKRDLIVGELKGDFRFYKNMGTDKNAIYKDFTYIMAEGVKANVPNF